MSDLRSRRRDFYTDISDQLSREMRYRGPVVIGKRWVRKTLTDPAPCVGCECIIDEGTSAITVRDHRGPVGVVCSYACLDDIGFINSNLKEQHNEEC